MEQDGSTTAEGSPVLGPSTAGQPASDDHHVTHDGSDHDHHVTAGQASTHDHHVHDEQSSRDDHHATTERPSRDDHHATHDESSHHHHVALDQPSSDEKAPLIPQTASTSRFYNSGESSCVKRGGYATGYILLFVIELGIPITMVTIGAIYKNSCPAVPSIPNFLMAFGASYLIYFASQFLVFCKSATIDALTFLLAVVIHLFCLAWLIAGTYWVFYSTPNIRDSASSMYCNALLYNFTAVITIAIWALGVPATIINFVCQLSNRETTD